MDYSKIKHWTAGAPNELEPGVDPASQEEKLEIMTPSKMNPDYDFLDHEVTHTASIVFEMFAEKIRDHPKVQENKEALKAAEYITNLLYAFYCSASGKQLEPTSQGEK